MMSEIFWIALTAVGTWLLALITWWLVKKEREISGKQLEISGKQLAISREQLKVKIQMDMVDKFEGPAMKSERKILANQIIAGADHEEIQEDVINFFESVGTLLRREYLDREMVWADFSFHAIRWWSACKDYILAERKRQGDDQTIFEDFEKLVDVLYRVESSRRKLSHAQLEPSRENIMQFLNDESKLK